MGRESDRKIVERVEKYHSKIEKLTIEKEKKWVEIEKLNECRDRESGRQRRHLEVEIQNLRTQITETHDHYERKFEEQYHNDQRTQRTVELHYEELKELKTTVTEQTRE